MATVDVLMPVREPAPWLEESLTALSAQTEVDWHLILVVHGADTSSSELARRLMLPVTVCRADISVGLPEVLGLGLARCTAPFVARMDADDVALPGRLSRTCGWLEDHQDMPMTASWAELIDPDGAVTGRSSEASSPRDLLRAMRWRNVVVHSSVTFRRDVIIGLGGYAAELGQVEDYDLWLRVLATGEIGVVPEVLVQHRIHPQQVSRRQSVAPTAAHAVGASRLALARARRESVLAARARQAVWTGRQTTRRWQRG
jgi:glycosyltransferase involved in cell wall biosynthesis